jgi:hypothetical protein
LRSGRPDNRRDSPLSSFGRLVSCLGSDA